MKEEHIHCNRTGTLYVVYNKEKKPYQVYTTRHITHDGIDAREVH